MRGIGGGAPRRRSQSDGTRLKMLAPRNGPKTSWRQDALQAKASRLKIDGMYDGTRCANADYFIVISN